MLKNVQDSAFGASERGHLSQQHTVQISRACRFSSLVALNAMRTNRTLYIYPNLRVLGRGALCLARAPRHSPKALGVGELQITAYHMYDSAENPYGFDSAFK